jgi:predicted nucleic acid-binding protein
MSRILVDSNVLLDVFEDDADWADWSESMLDYYRSSHILCINPVIYAEISIGFQKIEEVEKVIFECALVLENIPREALFLAGKAFLKYRKRQGNKVSPLPDFFIGAHAAVAGYPLITRDTSRVSSYFPTVEIISPGRD